MHPGSAPARARLEPVVIKAIASALEAHPRRIVQAPDRRQAAVMVPLFSHDGEPWLVLTKRTDTVRMHKGEISFPGGSRDPEDADLWTTALRETHEELGLVPDAVEQIGALDDHPTFASGYIVSPFVATFDPGEWSPSEHEIAEVIELPLAELARVGRVEVWSRQGIRYPMHLFDLDGHRVWGVTAFILRRFLDIAGPALGLNAPAVESSAS